MYIGLPLTAHEAARLFGLKITSPYAEDSWCRAYDLRDKINNWFESNGMKIRLYSTDKGQLVLGYLLKHASDVSNRFVSTTEMIMVLLEHKQLFMNEIKSYINNFEEVTIEAHWPEAHGPKYLENYPETIRFVEPFVIEFPL